MNLRNAPAALPSAGIWIAGMITLVASSLLLVACGDDASVPRTNTTAAAVTQTSVAGSASTTEPTTTVATTPATTSAPVTTTTMAPVTSTTQLPSSVEGLPGASLELGTAIDAARGSPCMTGSGSTGGILAEVTGDLGVDLMGGVTSFNGDVAATGVLFREIPYTLADGELAETHAKLAVNDVRTFVALAGFTAERPFATAVFRAGSPADMTSDWDVLPEQLFALYGDLPAEAIALFGEEYAQNLLILPSPDLMHVVKFPWQDLLRVPVPDLAIGQAARIEAWDRANLLINDLAAVTYLQQSDWTAAVGLEELTPKLDELEALLCVVLATERSLRLELARPHEDDPQWLQEHREIFLREVAAQEALLAVEYFRIIADHFSDPAIDWLRASGVDVSMELDGVTSTAESVVLWLDGATEALRSYQDLLTDAPAL